MALGEYLGSGSGITKGLYHLNGNANDSSGNGNNGTATNVTWVGGKIGSGAGSFNGSSSNILADGGYTDNQDITVSLWVNITNNPSGQSKIINLSSTGQYPVSLYYNTESSIQYLRLANSTDTVYTATYQINLSNTGWRNIIVTTSSGTQKIYIDGVKQGSDGTIGTATSSKISRTRIGCTYDGVSQHFNGLIDEVIIENRAWTATEIKKYYTYSKGRFIQ